MILADTNFWLALALSKHVFHSTVRNWFAGQSSSSVLFSRSTQQSFLRLLTTQSVLQPYGLPPMTNLAAWDVYQGFRSDQRISFANEPPNIEARWQRYATRRSASPKLWMDAYLAAFATAGGHRLVTTDTAFQQFKDLDSIILSR